VSTNERTSRRVELTDAGEALREPALALLAGAADAIDLVRRTGRGELGRVRLGVVGTSMVELLPALVSAIRQAHPEVELILTEATGGRQLADLRAGRLDLGLVHSAEGDPGEGMEATGLRDEPLALALPAGHRLAHRTVLRLNELRDEPLVMIAPDREADTSALYLDACAEAGFAPREVTTVTSLQGLLGLVASGLGWAFVARSVALGLGLGRDGVSFVNLRGTAARLPTSLVWTAGPLAPASSLVVDVARNI
jgi:DNA-binding transcriptional LysR family regulator